MYSSGGPDTGMFGNAYGFNVGAVYRGFSIDAVYTKEHSVVALQSAVNDTALSPVLAANINDNETFSIFGKYTYEFGGGYKDMSRGDRLTFYGGYTRIDQSDPKKIHHRQGPAVLLDRRKIRPALGVEFYCRLLSCRPEQVRGRRGGLHGWGSEQDRLRGHL
jgi:hypothetical protein